MVIASIKRNLHFLRWKLKDAEVAIKETLTCVPARSILVYLMALHWWQLADGRRPI